MALSQRRPLHMTSFIQSISPCCTFNCNISVKYDPSKYVICNLKNLNHFVFVRFHYVFCCILAQDCRLLTLSSCKRLEVSNLISCSKHDFVIHNQWVRCWVLSCLLVNNTTPPPLHSDCQEIRDQSFHASKQHHQRATEHTCSHVTLMYSLKTSLPT